MFTILDRNGVLISKFVTHKECLYLRGLERRDGEYVAVRPSLIEQKKPYVWISLIERQDMIAAIRRLQGIPPVPPSLASRKTSKLRTITDCQGRPFHHFVHTRAALSYPTSLPFAA